MCLNLNKKVLQKNNPKKSSKQSSNSNRSHHSIRSLTGGVKFKFSHFRKFIGPGLLVSIAYMDPGSLSGDLDAGTFGKTKLLWLLLCSTTYGLLFQTISSRVGIVSGCDLSTICKRSFKKHISFILWISCELAIIGSDIQEVVGSSVAFNLLFGIPMWGGALITICDTFIILFTTYFGMRKLELIFAVLVGSLFSCFLANLILIKPNVPELLLGCVYPRIPSEAMTQAVALIGSNLTPHNIYLHSSLVQSRNIDRSNKYAINEALMYFYIEAAILVFFAFFINLTVIGTFANATDEVGVQLSLNSAGDALRSHFGTAGPYIWAVGLLCSGQSATLTGTLSGQYVMQGFVNMKVSKFVRSIITRSLAIIPSILVVLFVGDVTVANQYINVSQVFILPMVVVPLLKVATDKNIMKEYKVGNPFFYFMSTIAVLLTAMNVYLNAPDPNDSLNGFIGYIVFFVLYLAVIVYICLQELESKFDQEEARKEFDSVYEPIKIDEAPVLEDEFVNEDSIIKEENDEEEGNKKNSDFGMNEPLLNKDIENKNTINLVDSKEDSLDSIKKGHN